MDTATIAAIKSTLKMAGYTALIAVVTAYLEPGRLEALGMSAVYVSIAVAVLKGILTWATTQEGTQK